MFSIVIIKREILQNRLGKIVKPTSSELTCSLNSLIRSDSTVTAAKAGSSSSLPLTFKIKHFASLLNPGKDQFGLPERFYLGAGNLLRRATPEE